MKRRFRAWGMGRDVPDPSPRERVDLWERALGRASWRVCDPDYDSVSSDDLLGSVQIREDEQGRGNVAKVAKSDVEGSVYYVTYAVN
ncbi:hypothetical protein [Kitasatospora purpeofusca]|uniref:hypothetical protein n=1 Tax=Kitasatospora purpeofusca TaxID=67352 RepID=UPI003869D5F4|nr:hypothetical protein OIP63_02490 [Kitasatospora purpeofusca]